MAQKSGSGGIGKQVLRYVGFFVLAGFAWAMLQQFNLDPFAIVGWAFDKLFTVVDRISDFFLNNGTFQKTTESPGLIAFFRS